jgi:hypothetical protein
MANAVNAATAIKVLIVFDMILFSLLLPHRIKTHTAVRKCALIAINANVALGLSLRNVAKANAVRVLRDYGNKHLLGGKLSSCRLIFILPMSRPVSCSR